MIGSVRAYSTSALGYIKNQGAIVSVLAPLPKQQMEIFAELKQKDRSKALKKVENAILFSQLNARNRNLVFKPTNAQTLESLDNPSTFDMDLGNTTKQINLEPRTYLGPPSRQDLRVLATTSHTPEELKEAVAYIHECLKSKELGRNFEPGLGGFLLQRAAKAGTFQTTFHSLTTNFKPFKQVLRQDFYSDALRIYALRTPYLSRRSKNMLGKIHARSNTGISRDLAYAYGLTEYRAKFGDHDDRLSETIEKIKSSLPAVLERPRASMKTISQVDLVLGRAALENCGLPGAEELAKGVESVMQQTARNRPLTNALVVNLADRNLDGITEHDEASEDASSQ